MTSPAFSFVCRTAHCIHGAVTRHVHVTRVMRVMRGTFTKSTQGNRPLPAPLCASTNEAYFFFAAFFAGFFAFFAAFFLAAMVLAPFKEGHSLAIPR